MPEYWMNGPPMVAGTAEERRRQRSERTSKRGRGGHGADSKNFMDGIPKGVFFLAGLIASDLYTQHKRKSR